MKPKQYKILSVNLKWFLVVALGYLLVLLTFQIFQGPERLFDVGDGYIIAEWPGPLWYWPPKEYPRTINLLDAYVEAFMVADPWLIGRTSNGWFAVEKKKGGIYYPLSSENQAKKITGIDFSSSDLITERPWSFWWPWTYGYKHRQTIVFIGGGYAIIVFLITIVRRTYRRRHKL